MNNQNYSTDSIIPIPDEDKPKGIKSSFKKPIIGNSNCNLKRNEYGKPKFNNHNEEKHQFNNAKSNFEEFLKTNQFLTLDEKSYYKLLAYIDDTIGKIDYEKMKNKDIFLFIGPTHSGKSTTINYLLGNKLDFEYEKISNEGNKHDSNPGENDSSPDEDEEIDVGDEMKIINYGKKPIIGNNNNSETLYASPYESKDIENLCYVDCPGFFDNRESEHELIGVLSANMIIRAAKTIKGLAIVSEYDSLKTAKGKIFIEGVVHIMMNMFEINKEMDNNSASQYENPFNSVYFYFTKIPEKNVSKNVIFNKIKHLTEDKKEIHPRQSFYLNEIVKRNKKNLFLVKPFDTGQTKERILRYIKNTTTIPKEQIHFLGENNMIEKLKNLISFIIIKTLRIFNEIENIPMHKERFEKMISSVNCQKLENTKQINILIDKEKKEEEDFVNYEKKIKIQKKKKEREEVIINLKYDKKQKIEKLGMQNKILEKIKIDKLNFIQCETIPRIESHINKHIKNICNLLTQIDNLKISEIKEERLQAWNTISSNWHTAGSVFSFGIKSGQKVKLTMKDPYPYLSITGNPWTIDLGGRSIPYSIKLVGDRKYELEYENAKIGYGSCSLMANVKNISREHILNTYKAYMISIESNFKDIYCLLSELTDTNNIDEYKKNLYMNVIQELFEKAFDNVGKYYFENNNNDSSSLLDKSVKIQKPIKEEFEIFKQIKKSFLNSLMIINNEKFDNFNEFIDYAMDNLSKQIKKSDFSKSEEIKFASLDLLNEFKNQLITTNVYQQLIKKIPLKYGTEIIKKNKAIKKMIEKYNNEILESQNKMRQLEIGVKECDIELENLRNQKNCNKKLSIEREIRIRVQEIKLEDMDILELNKKIHTTSITSLKNGRVAFTKDLKNCERNLKYAQDNLKEIIEKQVNANRLLEKNVKYINTILKMQDILNLDIDGFDSFKEKYIKWQKETVVE